MLYIFFILYIYTYKPPRLLFIYFFFCLFEGGVRLPTFCPGGTFASFGLKFNQKLANVPFVPKTRYFVSKIHKMMTFASLEGRKMLANVPF